MLSANVCTMFVQCSYNVRTMFVQWGKVVRTMFVQCRGKVYTTLYEPNLVRTIIVRTLYELICLHLLCTYPSCRRTFSELKDMIMDESVQLDFNCWCYRCNKYCKRGPRDGDHTLDLGLLGTPCTVSCLETL